MSTLQRFALVCILGAATAALLPGCSSDSDSGPVGGAGSTAAAGASSAGSAGTPGAAGSPGAAGGSALPTGDATKGAAAYAASTAACNICHGNMAEGVSTFGPNLSGSTTAGIGTWSQAEFFNAVRNGVGKDGMKLCATMAKYAPTDLSDQTLADIYAWLKTTKVDTVQKGSCP